MNKYNNKLIRSILGSTSSGKIIGAVIGIVAVMIDGVLIGRFLGNSAMSAYGLATPMTLIFVAIAGMIATGLQNLVGNSIGKGDAETVNKAYTSSLIFCVLLSTIIGAILYSFATPIAEFLGAKGNASYLLGETSGYIKGYMLCAPFAMLQIVMFVFIMFDGKVWIVTGSALIVLIVDVIGDLLNVFVFHGGLLGMAIASSLSIIAATLFMAVYFFDRKKSFAFLGFRIDFKLIGQSAVLGLSFLCKQLCNLVRGLLLNRIIISVVCNPEMLATLSIVSIVRTLALSTIGGIGEAVYMIAGVLLPEKDKKNLRDLLYASRRQTILLGIPLMAGIILTSPFLVSVFKNLPMKNTWTDFTTLVLVLFSLSIIPYSMQYIYRNYLMAMRKGKRIYAFTLLNELVAPSLTALLGAWLFKEIGFFSSFAVSELITVLIMIFVSIKLWKDESAENPFLQYSDELKCVEEVNAEFNDKASVEEFAATAYAFIVEKSNSEDIADLVKGAIEIIGGSIVSNAMKLNKQTGYFRVINFENEFMLKIRDNCSVFNPITYIETARDTNEMNCLKELTAIASTVDYSNMFHNNNLTITVRKREHE